MSEYPDLIFSRKTVTNRNLGWEKSRYAVRTRKGVVLGEVYSLYTGGWKAVSEEGEQSGYATRYEAGYALYPEPQGS